MFRSVYEEKAAGLLDFAHIKWEYEPHSFLLSETNEVYTPDFWLPELGIIIEVKGGRTRDRLHKPWLLQWQLYRSSPDVDADVCWRWSQRYIAVMVLTPEGLWSVCDPGDEWCRHVGFARFYCCEGDQPQDPHGGWTCRRCGEGGKYREFVPYDAIKHKWWDRFYDHSMSGWTP